MKVEYYVIPHIHINNKCPVDLMAKAKINKYRIHTYIHKASRIYYRKYVHNFMLLSY